MALNPPLTDFGEPCRVEGEFFIMKRKGIEFELKVQKGNKYTGKGIVIMTTCRLVLLNNKKDSAFKAFDIPLALLIKETFQQPFFGANYIEGTCQPLFNMLPGNIDFKIWFMEGGCNTFVHNFLSLVNGVRKNQNKGADKKLVTSLSNGTFSKTAYLDPNDPSTIYLEQPPVIQNNNNFNANPQQQQNFNFNNNNNFNANPMPPQQNVNQYPPNFNPNNNNNFNMNPQEQQNFNQYPPNFNPNNNNNFNANPQQNFNQYPPNFNQNSIPMNQQNTNNFNMPPSNQGTVPMMSGETAPQFNNQNNTGAPNVYNPYPDINQPYINNNVPTFEDINSNPNPQGNFTMNPNAQANISNTNYVNFDQQNNNAKYFGFWGPELKKKND